MAVQQVGTVPGRLPLSALLRPSTAHSAVRKIPLKFIDLRRNSERLFATARAGRAAAGGLRERCQTRSRNSFSGFGFDGRMGSIAPPIRSATGAGRERALTSFSRPSAGTPVSCSAAFNVPLDWFSGVGVRPPKDRCMRSSARKNGCGTGAGATQDKPYSIVATGAYLSDMYGPTRRPDCFVYGREATDGN